MATIVQPYNPWREQLALTALGNVAGNIISDLWKNHNQNEQNRKVNAFRGQLNQDLNNNAQNNAVSLTAMGAPDGYNSNPWANAFHKTDSPLTQFDIGTAGIGRTPSIQDIMRGVDSLAATSRFSMINPETIGKIRNDLLQGAYAEMFRNAGNDIQGQMNALTMGAANGVVAPQILAAFSPYAAHMTPHHESKVIDAGDRQVVMDYNPANGNYTQGSIIPMGINPTNLATANIAANAQRDSATLNANAHRDAANITANAENIRYNRAIEQERMKTARERITALTERRNLLMQDMPSNEQAALAYMQNVIKPIDDEIAVWNNYLMSGFQPNPTNSTGSNQTTQPTANNTDNSSNNIWFSMVGSPQGISIHPNGHFGANRVDHTHQGIDIRGIQEGTDIRLRPEMGNEFIVRQAYYSRSYGNNIVIESDRKINGKRLEFRIAHMQNGSLNLTVGQKIKAGDIVGKVGSTGRSSGPHIHLEVLLDGTHIDPQTFFETYPLQPQAQPTTKNATQNTGNNQRAQNTNPAPTQNNEPPYLVDGNGNYVTFSEFMKLAEDSGMELSHFFNYLEDKGYSLAGNQNNTSQSTRMTILGDQNNNQGNLPPAPTATPEQTAPTARTGQPIATTTTEPKSPPVTVTALGANPFAYFPQASNPTPWAWPSQIDRNSPLFSQPILQGWLNSLFNR